MDVIIPTWEQLNNFVVFAILVVIAAGIFFYRKFKREGPTVTWIRDWDEYR
jgi:LPXTG-motif cell wall-anchored protein